MLFSDDQAVIKMDKDVLSISRILGSSQSLLIAWKSKPIEWGTEEIQEMAEEK
jgi:hypothetical protein